MALKKKPAPKKTAQVARRTTRPAAVPARVPAAKPKPAAPAVVEKETHSEVHQELGGADTPAVAPAPASAIDDAGKSSLVDLIAAADADETAIDSAATASPAGDPEAMTREVALELAAGGVMTLLRTGEEVLTTAYPYVQVPDEKLQKVARAGAPLMLKYSGGEPPAWLNEWKEEILFFVAVGGLTFSIGSQIRQHEIAELKALEQRQKAQELARQNANRVNQGQAAVVAPAAAAAPAAASVARVDLSTGDAMAGIKGSGDL